MTDWWEKAKELYNIDESAVDRMAKVHVAEGGRIKLPEIGEELLVYVTRDPIEVESESLKERGIQKALFARCRKVEIDGGDIEVSNVEYDLPISKTMAMTAVASMKREGAEDLKMEGKVFLITARKWDTAPEEYRKGKGVVKTYTMVYKPQLTEKVRKIIEAEEAVLYEVEEEIEL